MKKLYTFILLALSVFLVACGNSGQSKSKVVKTDEEYKKFAEVNNTFAYETFRDLTSIENGALLKGEGLKGFTGENLIYSPYSYESALATLMNFTDGYDEDEKLKSFVDINPGEYELNNLQSQNIFMANKDKVKTNSDDPIFHKVMFPTEAEDMSKKLQNEMFERVLLEPKYDVDMTSVIINVTKFLGQWTVAFDEAKTDMGTFTKVDGTEMETDLMDTIFRNGNGYEDENLTMTKKYISTEVDGVKSEKPTSAVYIIVPKYGDDKVSDLNNIIENLKTYIEDYDEKKSDYNKVRIVMPKLDTKTTIDLKEIEELLGSTFIKTVVFLNKNVTEVDKLPQIIDQITQVANLKIDEKEVKAEAITQIGMTEATMAVEETELEVIADVPYLMVITSSHNDEDIISFMAYINSPEA